MWKYMDYIIIQNNTEEFSNKSSLRYVSDPLSLPAVSHPGVSPASGGVYLVSEGQRVDGVLSCQGDAAQQDEEEDDVGKCRGVDNAVAQLTEPGERNEHVVIVDGHMIAVICLSVCPSVCLSVCIHTCSVGQRRRRSWPRASAPLSPSAAGQPLAEASGWWGSQAPPPHHHLGNGHNKTSLISCSVRTVLV